MKKLVDRIYPSNFLYKLVIFGLLLGCLPISVVGIFSYYQSSDIIEEKERQSNLQMLLQTQMHVERVLMNTDIILRNFIDSPNTVEAIESDMSGKDFQCFQELSKRLNVVQPFDVMNTGACMVNISRGWVVNNNGLYRLSEAENAEKYRAFTMLPGPSMWVTSFDKARQTGKPVYDYFFSGDAVNLVKNIPLSSKNPKGLAIVKIPCEYLSQLLTYVNDDYSEMLILDSDFRVIASRRDRLTGADLFESDFVKRMAASEEKKGNFELDSEEGDINVTYLKSEYNGWYYVSKISIAMLMKQSRSIGWFTLSICAACLLIVSALSIAGSRRMYRPISNIYRNFLKSEPPVMEHDEFKYITKSVNALMANKALLENQVSMQIKQIKEFFTMKLIMGNIDKNELDGRMRMFNVQKPRYMMLMVIRADSLKDTEYNEGNRDILMFAINNIAEELLEGRYLLTPVIINQMQVTIVGGDQETYEQFRDDIYRVAESIQNNVNKHFNITISIGVSHVFHSFEETYRAFLEGQEALKYRIRLGNNIVLSIGDVQPRQNIQPLVHLKLQDRVVEAVKSADEEKAALALDTFLNEVFKMQVSHVEYQIPIAGLLTRLIAAVQEAGENLYSPDDGRKSLLEELFELQTQKEIKDWFSKVVIAPFMRILHERNESQHRNIAEQVLKIIHAEYDSDLTIETCAQRINYHPSYIRRVFLKEMGENFGEYLTKYRIEVAKRWLSETDMRVSDIAERLRYSNSQNFIRCFRKYTGVTLGQYRKGCRSM